MNVLIITVAVIVWLMAKLVGRSAERKPWLREIETRLQAAERRLDRLERQINTNRQAAHIAAAPPSVVASPSSQATPLFSSPAVCQSKEPNVPGAIPESIPELASRKTLADAKEPLSLTEPANELTDFLRSKRLVVEEPPARTLMPSSPFEKSWRRFEQMFSENWTGVLGAVVLVAGVTFIGIYTALHLAPFYRFLMTVGAAGVLGSASIFLRRREVWRPLAEWVRSAAAAILLFACAASGGLQGLGLQWIDSATPAIELLLLGIAVNLYLSWTATAQTFGSLHVALSVLPLLIVPQSAMSLGITSVVVPFGIFLSFRARWDQHLLIVIGTYVVYHVSWYIRLGDELDAPGLRFFAAFSAIAVFATAVLVHYRKDYASQKKLEPWPLLVHISNWVLLAQALIVYPTTSRMRGIGLGLAGIVAYLLARRARPLGIRWLYLCDTLIGQALLVAALVSLYPLIANLPLMLLAIFLESALFLQLVIQEGEDSLIMLGWFLANSAGFLLSVSGADSAFSTEALIKSQSALIMLVGAAAATVVNIYLTRRHRERLAVLAKAPFPAPTMGWLVGTMVIVALLNLAGNSGMETVALLVGVGLLIASGSVSAPGLLEGTGAAVIGAHAISWWMLLQDMPWEMAPVALHIGPLSALAALTIWLVGAGVLRKVAIYLLGLDAALSVYLFFNPVSPLIPGVAWLLLAVLALEVADRLEHPSAISVLLLGYGYLGAFGGAYALVIIQSPAYLGFVSARMLIELFGLGVILYWWFYHPRQTLREDPAWRRVHPFFVELGLIALVVTNIVEVPTQWRPVTWSLMGLAFLLPPLVRRIDERLKVYSVVFYWVSVANVAVIMSVFESPSPHWYDRPDVMSLIAISLQIGYIVASHTHLSLDHARYYQGLDTLSRLGKLIAVRRNLWVYYPFFAGMALFLFWRFDRSVLTLLWAAEAFAVFVLSAVLRESQFRYVALSALGVCLARLLFIDLAQANLGLRGAVFIGVGLLMLVMNAIYNRYRARFQ